MGVSDSLAAALKRQLLTNFPSSKIPMASELAAVGMNPLVARFLTTVLERHIVDETNRISYDPSEWLPAEQRSVVDQSIRDTKQIIRQSITFPASRWDYFLGLASDQVCRYLVSPIDTIFGYAFPGDGDASSSATIQKRLRSFAAYTDILDPVIASLPSDPDAIVRRMEFRYKLDEIARDVGHSITEWDSFAEPLFSLHEEVNGTRIVPTTRLASLAFSLWRQDVSDKIESLAEATGDTDVAEENLVDIMKESFEPPVPRRRATIVDADQVPVALNLSPEGDASDTLANEAPVAEHRGMRYQPEESPQPTTGDLPSTPAILDDDSAAIQTHDSGLDVEDDEHLEVAPEEVQVQPELDDILQDHDVSFQVVDDTKADDAISDDTDVADVADDERRDTTVAGTISDDDELRSTTVDGTISDDDELRDTIVDDAISDDDDLRDTIVDAPISDDDDLRELTSDLEQEPTPEPSALFDDVSAVDKAGEELELRNRSVDQIEEAVDAALAVEKAEQPFEFLADPNRDHHSSDDRTEQLPRNVDEQSDVLQGEFDENNRADIREEYHAKRQSERAEEYVEEYAEEFSEEFSEQRAEENRQTQLGQNGESNAEAQPDLTIVEQQTEQDQRQSEFALPDKNLFSHPEVSSPGDSRLRASDDLQPRAERSSSPSNPNRPTVQDSILSERLTATPRRPPGEPAGPGPVPLWKQFHKKLNAPMVPDRPETVHSRNKSSSDQPTVADSLTAKAPNKGGPDTRDSSKFDTSEKGEDLAPSAAKDSSPTDVRSGLHERVRDRDSTPPRAVNKGEHAAEPIHGTDELEASEESVKPLWLRYQKKVNQPSQKAERPAEDLSEIERRVFGRTDMERRNRFINELFDGSQHSYVDVLTQIDAAKEWSRASHIIAHSVFRRYRINIYSDVAVTFTNAVEQRYLQ